MLFRSNREVRRLWEAQGVTVSRLLRVRYGPVGLARRLRPGRWEELTAEDLNALLTAVGMEPEARRAGTRARTRSGNRPGPKGRGAQPPRKTSRRPSRKPPGKKS